MKLAKRGKNISKTEVLNISQHGFWIAVGEKEYFLPFEEYGWFRDATIAQIQEVEFLHERHLHWPQLDVDLELDSLECPEQYPLTYSK